MTAAFKVLEDGNDLGDESYATVLDRSVESYVVIALDMSSSVAGNGDLLPELITRVGDLVDDLAAGPGDPPLMELVAFGRSVHIKEAFTPDPLILKAALEEMLANPGDAVDEPDGTNLNGVVNFGLDSLEGIIEARIEQTGGAVISTGTLITITDGRDTGGVRLETIKPRFNVIHACGTFLACAPPCQEPPADAGPARDAWDFSD